MGDRHSPPDDTHPRIQGENSSCIYIYIYLFLFDYYLPITCNRSF